ncbi:MAG: 23S rRNA (guanosine(2251)-2'-O)-methyltransferase RlmB [Pseudomonadota bacterium]|nr:23S rRNA (guanosine(2251)-2'-O)-methyltransferase RlmB [Pseudomonadota bacterium]
MASHRQRNDRPEARPKAKRLWSPSPAPGAGPHHRRRAEEGQSEWLWGWHAVVAALENPARPSPKLLLASADRARALAERLGADLPLEVMESAAIAQALPSGVIHQGVALRTPPIEPVALDELATPARGLLLMLDQVTDPQNVGAIFRSAAAFGARGVVVQDRHAPALTGALAKAAAGAVDKIPHARETNLSRALERLETLGWRSVGLDGAAENELADVLDGAPTVLVLGSEGEGLRRLVGEHCEVLARIPMPGRFESLNVAAAAAVALYEAGGRRR